MFQHVLSCEEFNHRLTLCSLADIFSDTRTTDHTEHVYNSVIDNCKQLILTFVTIGQYYSTLKPII